MKVVMISIKTGWCKLIKTGEKTIEVRKTKPKCKVPFKCYIYECKDKKLKGVYKVPYQHSFGYGYSFVKESTGSGKVIGEFICNGIDVICPDDFVVREDAERTLEGSCISADEFKKYMKYVHGTPLYMLKDAYAWHISDLVIYDKPKELSEFGVKRPPQSWMYAEVE